MKLGSPGQRRRAVAALIVSAVVCDARAEGVTLLLNPEFSIAHITNTDQAGHTTFTDTSEFGQLYRLTLDKQFTPYLSGSAGGLFHKTVDWTTTDTGSTRSDDTTGDVFARLSLGSPLLNGAAGFERRMEASGLSPSPTSVPTLVNDSYTLTGGWRPLDLPSLNMILSRVDTYDTLRAIQDVTNSDALLSLGYRGIDRLNLLYSLRYLESVDHLHASDQTAVIQYAQATYNDRLFQNRTSVYLNGLFTNTTEDVSVHGTGGTVSTQRLPIAGLSLVETFPATLGMDTLAINPQLIDGNTTASANVNIGFNPSLAGDTNYRDVGVRFQDAVTPVNTFYLYVDRALPAQISAAFTWAAYSSSDNVTWTPVPLGAAPVFNSLQNRFEITIAQTQAIYLKLVVRPLAPSVTTDRTYADIFVTEIQPYLVQPASAVQGHQSFTTATLNATQRTLLVDALALAWDTSFFVTHGSALGQAATTSYNLTNGLSATQRLGRFVAANERVSRLDQDSGQGHLGSFQWAGTLSADPLPTLGGGLTYTGSWGQTFRGSTSQEAVFLFSRADLYTGLSVQANIGYSSNLNDTGRTTGSTGASFSLSALPHRTVTLTATYNYSEVTATGGAVASGSQTEQQLSAALTWAPFPALFFSGAVTRLLQEPAPTTLINVASSFSPFAGGALLLRFGYNESIDTLHQTDTRSIAPGLRWTIRSGWFLDAGYTIIDVTTGAVSSQHEKVFQTILTIML